MYSAMENKIIHIIFIKKILQMVIFTPLSVYTAFRLLLLLYVSVTRYCLLKVCHTRLYDFIQVILLLFGLFKKIIKICSNNSFILTKVIPFSFHWRDLCSRECKFFIFSSLEPFEVFLSSVVQLLSVLMNVNYYYFMNRKQTLFELKIREVSLKIFFCRTNCFWSL